MVDNNICICARYVKLCGWRDNEKHRDDDTCKNAFRNVIRSTPTPKGCILFSIYVMYNNIAMASCANMYGFALPAGHCFSPCRYLYNNIIHHLCRHMFTRTRTIIICICVAAAYLHIIRAFYTSPKRVASVATSLEHYYIYDDIYMYIYIYRYRSTRPSQIYYRIGCVYILCLQRTVYFTLELQLFSAKNKYKTIILYTCRCIIILHKYT